MQDLHFKTLKILNENILELEKKHSACYLCMRKFLDQLELKDETDIISDADLFMWKTFNRELKRLAIPLNSLKQARDNIRIKLN